MASVQCLAANVDTVFIVQAANNLNTRRLEREVAQVRACRVTPVVVLTKVDLSQSPHAAATNARDASRDCPVLLVNAVSGEGMEELGKLVPPGSTAALLGASGVGKSTITNSMMGYSAMVTGDVRENDQRGRHTTTARYLHVLPEGGALIDTPGLRAVGLLSADGLDATFPEIAALSEECRFRDCAHIGEPGCAVLGALNNETLDEGRLSNYRKLEKEVEYQRRRTDPQAMEVHKRRWKAIATQNRNLEKR